MRARGALPLPGGSAEQVPVPDDLRATVTAAQPGGAAPGVQLGASYYREETVPVADLVRALHRAQITSFEVPFVARIFS